MRPADRAFRLLGAGKLCPDPRPPACGSTSGGRDRDAGAVHAGSGLAASATCAQRCTNSHPRRFRAAWPYRSLARNEYATPPSSRAAWQARLRKRAAGSRGARFHCRPASVDAEPRTSLACHAALPQAATPPTPRGRCAASPPRRHEALYSKEAWRYCMYRPLRYARV